MNDAAYRIAVAHLPGWGYAKINNLIKEILEGNGQSFEKFFSLNEKDWINVYGLDEKQVSDLRKIKSELPGISFLAESYLNQGFEIISLDSQDYSEKLKRNYKQGASPPLLYVKGNKNILKEYSTAIVGSRNAGKTALDFTDIIAKSAAENSKVVVSGFAKGVDMQALESSIHYNGRSIIVLPQGILTFESGFTRYYKQILNGDVLVLSTFFPKSPWKAELAMARNSVIYALADEIYVAESAAKGGTWSGAIDGLRKGRKVFVRMPEPDEKNANELLIGKGAISVDMSGHVIGNTEIAATVSDAIGGLTFEEKVRNLLDGKLLDAKELVTLLNPEFSVRKMNNILSALDFVEKIKIKNKNFYRIKNTSQNLQGELF